MPPKRKSVHLETLTHKRLKIKALKEDTTIERIVNDLLVRQLNQEVRKKK